MLIRQSTEADINRIMEIYDIARKFMADHGNPNQWGPTNWPPEELIRQDIAEGKSYVCLNEDGGIIGTFFYDYGDDIEPLYRNVTEGRWRDSEPYGVVHRVAGDGSVSGVGTFCLNWAYERCGHLKIDTHGDNTVMQGLLNRLGFERRGIVYVVEDNYPRYAYEK